MVDTQGIRNRFAKMKIRSKFKDYYDYIGQRYGEDPEVVYNRGKIPGGGEIKDEKLLKEFGQGRHYRRYQRKDELNSVEYDLEYLVAGEMVFPMVRAVRYITDSGPFIDYQPLDRKMLYWMNNSMYPSEEKLWDQYQAEISSPPFKKVVRELMLKAGVPVFKIGRTEVGHRLEISENTPILKNFWIPSLVKPEVMWQNIYATITNVLRKNPDKEVPVQLKDKDRIVKAGFDLKSSFRHPVNQKKPRRIK